MKYDELTSKLWEIADICRGPLRDRATEIVLPLVLLRRMDCLLAPTKQDVLEAYTAYRDKLENLDLLLRKTSGLAFYNFSPLNLETLLNHRGDLLDNLESYVQGFSSNVVEVLKGFAFDTQIAKLAANNRLGEVVECLTDLDLHLEEISHRVIGLTFDNLLHRHSEAQGLRGGSHFTPRDLVNLLVELILTTGHEGGRIRRPGAVFTVYDPCCGSGGMLTGVKDHILGTEDSQGINPDAQVYLFGQDCSPEAMAVCKASLLLRDPTGSSARNIEHGSTLGVDLVGDRRFDYMIANPPFAADWRGDQAAVEHEARMGSKGRFPAGTPKLSDSQLLFLQAMLSHMKAPSEGGSRLAMLTSRSPLLVGGVGSGESKIRRWILEHDWLEAVIALPDQILHHTNIPVYVWVLSNRKAEDRVGKVQLIDATGLWEPMAKSEGDKRRIIETEHRAKLLSIYGGLEQSARSQILESRELGYRQVRILQTGLSSEDHIKVPLTRRPVQFFEEHVRKHAPEASIDESVRDHQDGEVGRVGYEIDFRRFRWIRLRREAKGRGLTAVPSRAILQDIRRSKSFIDTDSGIFVPRINPGRAYLYRSELPRPDGYLQLILRPEGPVSADFMVEYLNSREGKKFKEAIASWGLGQLSVRDWLEATFFLPKREEQEQVLDLTTEIRLMVSSLESLRHKVWHEPRNVVKHRSEFKDLRRSDDPIDWLQALPYPLASVYWEAHAAKENPHEQLKLLGVFFEATAEFTATVFLSGFRNEPEFFKQEQAELKATFEQRRLSVQTSTFGFWVAIVEKLAKSLRTHLNSGSDASNRMTAAFRVHDSELLNHLAQTEVVRLLKQANHHRNKELAHGGVLNSSQAKDECEFLQDLVSDYRAAVKDLWEIWPLIIPGQGTFDDSVYEYSSRRVMGPHQRFETIKTRSEQPAKSDALHLHDSQAESTLPLLPFVQVRKPLATALETCYFYNRMEGGEARFVCYHYGAERERFVADESVADAVALLSHDRIGEQE